MLARPVSPSFGRRSVVPASFIAILGLLIFGCDAKVTGPAPAVEDPTTSTTPLPVAPGIVCRDQKVTDVVITGTNFSPVPIDVPNNPRTALPTVTLTLSKTLDGSAGDMSTVVYDGDPDKKTNTPLLTWESQSQMTLRVSPPCTDDPSACGAGYVCHSAGVCAKSAEDTVTGPLAEGIYDLTVQNPNTNQDQSVGALAVIEKPTLGQLTPSMTCLSQGPRDIVLTGTRLLTVNDLEATVSIETADTNPLPVNAGTFTSCTPIPHAGFTTLQQCTGATITLAQDGVDVGYPHVNINNPETAACISVDAINLRVVPPPHIDSILEVSEDPTLAATTGTGTVIDLSTGPRQIVLHGIDFLEVDSVLPAVTLTDAAGTPVAATSMSVGGCEPLETMGLTVNKCTSLTIEVPTSLAAAADAPYQPTVVVTNPEPAGCNDNTSDRSTLLTIAPPPDIVEVVPPMICVDEADQVVVINGTDFLTFDTTNPAVMFGTVVPTSITPETCTPVDVGNKIVQRCASLRVTIPQDGLPPGEVDTTVTNPPTANGTETESGLLTIVAPPALVSIEPSLVCTDDGSRQLVITGTGFLSVDGTLPTATFDGTAATTDSLGGTCTDVAVNGLTVQECDTLTVTVAANALTEGNPLVVVTNPTPAACSGSSADLLTVPPSITVTSITPGSLCIAALGGVETLTLAGTGFLQVDGTPFAVTVNGQAVTPTNITGCNPLTVSGITAESCTGFDVPLDTNGLAAGPVPIVIDNPAPSECTYTTSDFVVVQAPSITSIDPVCSDIAPTTIAITGANIGPDATITITAQGTGTATPADSVNFISDTQLEATFNAGLPPDTYDVTVDNGGGCMTTSTSALIVHPTPLVFFTDPPVVYNGINTSVTIYTSGLESLAAEVALEDASGTVTPLTSFSNPDATRPNRTLANVPSGLAVGTYEVSVVSAFGCASSLNGSLDITDALTLELVSIDPAFASPTKETAATISSNDPPTGGFVNFNPLPRVYLNPTSDPAAIATALQAVVQEDPATLNGIIPAGMVPGTYDLIVVNPTGEVGLLPGAVTVTTAEPPFVTSIAPATVDANTAGQIVEVVGQDFGTDVTSMTLTLSCQDFATGTPSPVNGTANITASTGTSLTVSVNMTGVAAGTICEITVTNPDGSSYRFSALSVKEPAQNLNPWAFGPDMLEARRAPTASAGRPTDRSRFLYVIGGDDGVLAGAKTSVEHSAIGIYGGMSPWEYQRNDLSNAIDASDSPASLPRTFADITRIGQFIYVTGGHDGTSATDTVLRAQILRPQDAPEVVTLDAALGDGTLGQPAGVWYYRVTALFPNTDPSNPTGETLPGEVLPVQLPDIPQKLILTLNWEEIPGASGYRVYRTPVADDVVTNMQLIGETTGGTATSLTDDGLTADPNVTPLSQGALGIWHVTSTMGMAREGHATVAAQNPLNASEWWLYAFGGRDATGTVTATGEFAVVTLNADGSQTLGPWTPTTASLSAARAELGGFVVTSDDSNNIPTGTVNVLFSQGRTGTGTSSAFDSAIVSASGDITLMTPFVGGGPNPDRVGATDLQANGWMFILGGSGGTASTAGTSGEVVAPGVGGGWNALGGGTILETLIHAGSAKESAFFFVVGGDTGVGVTSNIEQTIQ